MSVLSVLRPILRLPKLLREPGGLALADALKAAHKNLQEAGGGYMREVSYGVAEVTTMAQALPAAYDEAAVIALYHRAGALIGVASVCDRPSIDEALTSLCDLLDHFRTRETFDAEAVRVHINALRLLLASPDLEGREGGKTILEGLHRVSEHYEGAGV